MAVPGGKPSLVKRAAIDACAREVSRVLEADLACVVAQLAVDRQTLQDERAAMHSG